MHMMTLYMTSQPSQRPSWAGSTASTGPATLASMALQVLKSHDVDTSLGHGGATPPAFLTETDHALPPGEQINPSPHSWSLR